LLVSTVAHHYSYSFVGHCFPFLGERNLAIPIQEQTIWETVESTAPRARSVEQIPFLPYGTSVPTVLLASPSSGDEFVSLKMSNWFSNTTRRSASSFLCPFREAGLDRRKIPGELHSERKLWSHNFFRYFSDGSHPLSAKRSVGVHPAIHLRNGLGAALSRRSLNHCLLLCSVVFLPLDEQPREHNRIQNMTGRNRRCKNVTQLISPFTCQAASPAEKPRPIIGSERAGPHLALRGTLSHIFNGPSRWYIQSTP
jgi:hypothetical protein